jgi:sugar lactone lactonase YvrE
LPGDTFGADGSRQIDRTGQAASVSTLAGAPWQAGLVEGPAASSRFNRPGGVAVDSQGRIFVADAGNHAIRMIGTDAAHTVQTIVGNGQPGVSEGAGSAARLNTPRGIAVAGDGTLYVADSLNHRIVRIQGSPPWTVSTFAGSSSGSGGYVNAAGTAARFIGPFGIAVSGSDVYVADSGNNRLRRIDSGGNVTTVVGDGAPGSNDGAGVRARLNFPTGVAAGSGALWVIESQNHSVRRIALDGAFTTSTAAGGGWSGGYLDGSASSSLFLPMFGVLAVGNSVLVADTGNNRIRRVASGSVTTYAGSGGAGALDGAAATASLTLPFGLAALGDGRIVVSDEGDSTIRILQP